MDAINRDCPNETCEGRMSLFAISQAEPTDIYKCTICNVQLFAKDIRPEAGK